MAIASLPVWTFPANWDNDVVETLEWLTDIMGSWSGAEQRRALRKFPRRSFEFETLLKGPERAYFENAVAENGSGDWYFPLWHEVHLLEDDASQGSNTVACTSLQVAGVRVGDVMVLLAESVFEHELIEVASISAAGITTAAPLAGAWSRFTTLHPVKRGRLMEQPSVTRLNDRLVSAQIRHKITEPNSDIADDVEAASTYLGFEVLTAEPDEADDIEYGSERMVETLDNLTSIPKQVDTAGISFSKQQFRWMMKGRAEQIAFRQMLARLRGRAAPIWVPTFFADFDVLIDVQDGATELMVRNCGYDGPTIGRDHLCVFLTDGTTLQREITGVTVSGDVEILALGSSIEEGFSKDDVLRISLLVLCRQEQDRVEIAHYTDSEGVAASVLSFRGTPDLRQVEDGF